MCLQSQGIGAADIFPSMNRTIRTISAPLRCALHRRNTVQPTAACAPDGLASKLGRVRIAYPNHAVRISTRYTMRTLRTMGDVESLGMRQWQGFFHQKV